MLFSHHPRSSHHHRVLMPPTSSWPQVTDPSFLVLSSQQSSGDFHDGERHFCPHPLYCSHSRFCPLALSYPHTQLPKELRSVWLKGFQALRGAHPSAGDLAAFLGLSVPKNKQLQRHRPLPGIGEEHAWFQPIAGKQPSTRTMPWSQQHSAQGLSPARISPLLVPAWLGDDGALRASPRCAGTGAELSTVLRAPIRHSKDTLGLCPQGTQPRDKSLPPL